MKKLVLLVILEQYADWEAAYFSSMLMNMARSEYMIKTVSVTKEPIHSIGGFTILPDYDLESVPAEFEALILVGGMSWRTEAARRVEPLVKAARSRGNVIGGICDASAYLGTIGMLNDIRHTSNDLNDLKEWAGSAYTGEKNYLIQPAVNDRSVVTANGTAALEFAREVLLALQVASEAKILEWYNFYKCGPYEAPMPTL